ncbi:hypothetical protein BOW53_01075 [Solemya pervernicosa gill symbiont]|uniref:Peptidase S54 rhomboid domain-containing protein n=1 Tax=Solemya pervernicosa gill symbiont TaxID=642797 RepID=A0A1T2LB20_9GAMM|nr:hypothetical protein BOW53_01075 [Solemya pervernicosa gill symbiont]
MFFFPYRVDLSLNHIPLLTILLSIICIFIYGNQVSSEELLHTNTLDFCTHVENKNFDESIKLISGNNSTNNCANVLLSIHRAQNKSEHINKIVKTANNTDNTIDIEQIRNALVNEYSAFTNTTPLTLTSRIQYSPSTYHVLNMISASFAHGNIYHLIGNLIFFYAFAASIEIIVGWKKYLFSVLTLCIGTNLSYSISTIHDSNALPTIGLSGVVMGMIGLFAFLMPTVRIKCILF